jgi:hypothetical protein
MIELVSKEARLPQMALQEALPDASDEAPCELTVSRVTVVEPSLVAAIVSVDPVKPTAYERRLAEWLVLKDIKRNILIHLYANPAANFNIPKRHFLEKKYIFKVPEWMF